MSHCQTTPCRIQWQRKIDIACFRKVLKTTHFDAFLFHQIRYFGTTDSVELNVAFFDIFNSVERPLFP